MIKRLYLVDGTLQTSLPKWSEDISVDAGTATYMLSVLNIGDWAYLAINWYEQTEIIKVYLSYSGLQVLRAQDGTNPGAFPAGATIKYQLTQAEIQDKITALDIPTPYLYASGYGVATVNEVNGAWVIGYPDIDATVAGGIRTFYEDVDATLYLTDYFPAAGCCTVAGSGAPLIGGPFFYFTSQPYAVEAIDNMQPGPNPKYPGENSFGFGNIWLLTQPSGVDKYVASTSGVNFCNVFGSSGSFTAKDQYVAPAGASIGYVNVFGTAGSFSVFDSSFIGNNNYILQANLFGSAVAYNFGLDRYVGTKSFITSANLI